MTGVGSNGTNLKSVLGATLANLKELRTSVVTACSAVEAKVKELDGMKAENEKLKYQILHLTRSLEAEEA